MRRRWTALLGTAGLVSAALILVGSLHDDSDTVRAAGICDTATMDINVEERDLINRLTTWRAWNFPSAMPLEESLPLHAAASHYARYLAETPGAQGHYAEPGYTHEFAWGTRAIDCGYPSRWAAGGEGLAVFEGTAASAVDALAAIQVMAAHQGSGIYVPANNARCLGVGMYRTPTKVAWVALIFQYSASQPCPQAYQGQPRPGALPDPTPTASPSPSPSPTATATPSPSPTPSPTPEPTPDPTPTTWFRFVPGIASDG
jgi:hypothetical protein